MKKLINRFLIAGLAMMICFTFTLAPAKAFNEPVDAPKIALDSHSTESSTFLRNFRHFDSTMKEPPSTINKTDLNELNMSGSSQFERSNIDVIRKTANKFKVTVVDLRQESHGFVNGLPISWKNERNNANKGLSKDEVIELEKKQLGTITINRPFTIIKNNGKTTIAKSVETEEELVKNHSMKYIRIPVTDGGLPTDDMVDYFVEFAKSQPKNSYLHFHCKEGIGRTSTFMIMYDIMKNAPNVSLDDIINRQLALSTLGEKHETEYRTDVRMKFLNKFYDYVKNNKDDYKVKWSDYIKSN